jgi:glycosyltransferase involved in cell wall biosynthesis
MRIVYLNQDFPPEVGAGPARVSELSRRWIAAGAEVTVVTAFPSRRLPGQSHQAVAKEYRRRLFARETHGGANVLRSWVYTASRTGFRQTAVNNASFMVTSALHALRRVGPVDVVIASSPPFLPHLTGALLARARRAPLVLEVRDLWPDYLVQMGMLKRDAAVTRALFSVERSLLGAARQAVVVTDSFKRRMIEKGVPAERVAVIPNGVDTAFYQKQPSARSPDVFTVGYIGTFGAGQALPVIIDAAALLQTEAPEVRIVLVGQGSGGPIIEQRIRELGVTNVTVRPPIEKAETPAFYSSCDVCLVPLAPIPVFQETVPSKLFEIMACERPVLASLDGEARTIVEQSGAGIVVPPGDARAIADGILRMRAIPENERERMGGNGRAYVTEHYNRDKLAAYYLTILQSLT